MLLTLFIYNLLILDKTIIENLSDCKYEEQKIFKTESKSSILLNKLKDINNRLNSMSKKSKNNKLSINKNIINAKNLD
tara:strand:+ start:42 stop:275 length:234 start_codon:yes stop_codon:yes gene_type:complete